MVRVVDGNIINHNFCCIRWMSGWYCSSSDCSPSLVLCSEDEVDRWFMLLLVNMWIIACVVYCLWGEWIVHTLAGKIMDHCLCCVLWMGRMGGLCSCR